MLGHQLAVLQRSSPKPAFTRGDRAVLAVLLRLLSKRHRSSLKLLVGGYVGHTPLLYSEFDPGRAVAHLTVQTQAMDWPPTSFGPSTWMASPKNCARTRRCCRRAASKPERQPGGH
ncbi:hypothetical protein GCM10010121_083350 [Streptomyces brasiliensis]|uniref:Uncharacterized protein n=1 Tax=Streptomyces brasiliensis TaxID=1954 RepID=A0A917LDE4_9ACTN|nr:hypothetical protein GCM10010121_083350 [Streptomyces brasiliensis]